MKNKGLFAFLFMIVLHGTAYADEMSHRQSVLKLLDVTNSRQMLDQVNGSINIMMDKQFESLNLNIEGKEAAKAVKREMSEWFADFFQWERMREIYVDIYKDVFTEQEVNEMVGFYQSPLGQKMLKKMPELLQVTMQKTQALLQQRMPEFQKRLQRSMAELEKKHKTGNSSSPEFEVLQ